MSTKCAALTKAGTPCKNWAVRESDPPRCSSHGGGKTPIGAPANNENARRHGVYSGNIPSDLDARIKDLDRRVQQLSHYIDVRLTTLEPDDYRTLFNLQGSLTSRLGRLMRYRQEATGDLNELDEAIKEALAVTSELLGVDLEGASSKKRTLTLPAAY